MPAPTFVIGQRVQAHPRTARWLKGCKTGTIVDDGGKMVVVAMDRGSPSRIAFFRHNLLPLEQSP
jgi:hypothetical protein